MAIWNFACLFYFWLIVYAYFKTKFGLLLFFSLIMEKKEKNAKFSSLVNYTFQLKKGKKKKRRKTFIQSKNTTYLRQLQKHVFHTFYNKSHSLCLRSSDGGPENVWIFLYLSFGLCYFSWCFGEAGCLDSALI